MIEFEIELTLYDRLGSIGEGFPDSIKMAVLTEGAPNKPRERLQVNSERYTTYAQVRTAVTSFFPTRENVTKQENQEESNDMQVDALGNGNVKGKKKGGKGKQGKKGEYESDYSGPAGKKGKHGKEKGKKGGK